MAKKINEKQLSSFGFTRYLITYEGCPDHPGELECPVDNEGNCLCKSGKAPYWRINGDTVSFFIAFLTKQTDHIAYLFSENDGECRKIGQGKTNRVRDNLKAHYNHGLTKVKLTAYDRKYGNQIAKRCRNASSCYIFVKPVSSKNEAEIIESRLKSIYAGWLDYDQQ